MAPDPINRTAKMYGDPIEASFDDIVIDPRWALEAPDSKSIPKTVEMADAFPILVREKDGIMLCVAPAERVLCLKEAAKQKMIPDKAKVFVMPGVTDEDADFVRELVRTATTPEPSDEWRERVNELIDELETRADRPWARKKGKEFASALTGLATVSFWRWRALQEKGVKEVRALVDDGTVSLRTAVQSLVNLPDDRQREAAAALAGKNRSEVAKIAREFEYEKPISIEQITHQVDVLAHAAERGEVKVELEKLNELQYQVSLLYRSCR